MTNIQIREIHSPQIEQYKAFLSVALAEDGDNLLLTERDNLQAIFPTKDSYDSFTIGAYSNSVLAGIASFNRDGTANEKLRHKGFISTMYVLKRFRGMGIAGKLLQEIITRAKAIPGIEQINLIVISDNIKARGLYEKFGFKKYGTELNSIKWGGSYWAEDLMTLSLI